MEALNSMYRFITASPTLRTKNYPCDTVIKRLEAELD